MIQTESYLKNRFTEVPPSDVIDFWEWYDNFENLIYHLSD